MPLKHDESNNKKLEKELKNENDILKEYGTDEIALIYKTTGLKKGDKIKIFGEQFVINNKDNSSIIHNKQKYNLKDYFVLPETNKKEISEIKLKGIKSLTNISNIFSYNFKLISSPDISEWNTIKITYMSKAFLGCYNLSGLSGISKWNTQNVENMLEIFANCEDAVNLPDISRWNLSNVKSMNKMFYNCIKLKSLPDISKWKTNKIIEMKSLFEKCENLKNIPEKS